MRKEVLLAIFVGVILGGVILYGINLANQSVGSTTPTTSNNNTVVTPTPSTSKQQSLSIISPADHSVHTEKIIRITGKTEPGSTLAIISESDDIITESSSDGNFSADINLISGENTITVSQLQKDNSINTVTLSIIHTSNLPE